MWPFSTVTEPKRFTKASACSPSSVTHPQVGYTAIVFGSIFAWWRSFRMQPFEMGDQLRLTGPTAQVETEHLIGAFGRRAPDPQADQQAGDQGHIDLHPHTIGRMTQQVSA